MENYKIVVKENNRKIVYQSNEMSSALIKYELDWLNSQLKGERGFIVLIKRVKSQDERRRKFERLMRNSVNLDDLDKLKI